ncbi:MAG: signal peptidase I [Bacilli bacterium]|nr:signal peptidase I [Bacilli bacterium]
MITFIFIKNIHNKIELVEPRRIIRKNSSLKLIPILIPILFIICFITGVFKYKPIAILSNSMHPIFNRGDVVIIQKLEKNDLRKIKKYDIIEYMLDNDIITHRVIHIEKHNNNNKLYTTMGDNNNAPDIKKVKEEQILGKVIFTIPKIGYPSIWLRDFLTKNKKPNVETGK